jgi:predicted N-acetyltransferase YhbS
VRALLREAFEVRPGVGEAFALLYDHVLKTPSHSRVAIFEGRVIGHALLASRKFDLAGLSFRGGILAMVVVEEGNRGQGIGRALIYHLETFARESGMVVLQVSGDPRIYTKFGFIPAYVEAKAETAIKEMPFDRELRLAIPEDVSQLAKWSLDNRIFGAVVADEGRWQWVLQTEHPKAMVQCNNLLMGVYAQGDACLILDDVGFVRGCWAGERFIIYEAGSSGDGTVERLLASCLAWAYQIGCRRLTAFLPPRNQLLKLLAKHGAAVKIQEDYELQAKVIHVVQVLKSMSMVFSIRMLDSEIRGKLGLSVGNIQVELTIGDEVQVGQVDVIGNVDWHLGLSQAALTRAVLGVDLLHDPENDPVLEDLLARLFPQCGPFFCMADSL